MKLFLNYDFRNIVCRFAILVTITATLNSCNSTEKGRNASLMSKRPTASTDKIWCGNQRAFLTVELSQQTPSPKSLDFKTIGNMDDVVGVRHNIAGKISSDADRQPKSAAWKDSIVYTLPDKKANTGKIITSTIMIQPGVFYGKFADRENMDTRYVTKNGDDPEISVSMTCKVEP